MAVGISLCDTSVACIALGVLGETILFASKGAEGCTEDIGPVGSICGIVALSSRAIIELES